MILGLIGYIYYIYRPPFDDYEDCDGVKYFVQLNLYKYMLKNFYQMDVSNMYVVSFHPNQASYQMIHVPDMESEINAIMNAKDLYFKV